MPSVALGAFGCLAGCDLTASLRSGISKPQRRKEARAEVLIIHSDHPCQHLATITPLVAELDEMECFFMGSLIHPHPPSYLFAITWDVFIFRDLGFDKSTAILFFGILKWVALFDMPNLNILTRRRSKKTFFTGVHGEGVIKCVLQGQKNAFFITFS